MENFAEIIEKERAKLLERRQALILELDEIDRELNAMEAYAAAKRAPIARSGSGTRRSGIRDEVRNLVKENGTAMTRAEILTAMQAEGDKKLTQSISNALAALKKSGRLVLRDGSYSIS